MAASSPSVSGVDVSGEWQLASGQVGAATLDLTGGRPVTFTIEGDQVSGSSACNTYRGNAKIDGSSVRFRQLGGTEMACEPAVMDLEQLYLQALGTVDTAGRTGQSLVLSGPGVRLTFDVSVPTANRELVGTTWILDSLIQGDAVSSTTFPATLALAADGTLSGTAGCPPFTGTYERADGVLRMKIIVDPRIPCVIEEQYQAIVDVLADELTVAIDGARLTLTAPDGQGLGYHAEDPAS